MPKPCTQCGFTKEIKKKEATKCGLCKTVLNVPYKEHIATDNHKQNKDILKQVKSIIVSNKKNELMTKLNDLSKHF
jgi:hypothetical protein